MIQRSKMAKPTAGLRRQIDLAVEKYLDVRPEFELLAGTLLRNLVESSMLKDLIHSTKYRTKDPDHLRDKLQRKAFEAQKSKKEFLVSKDSIFERIEDLAGVRLLHLHTKQLAEIHPAILEILDEHRYQLVGKPVANTWDIENERFFKSLGLKTTLRESMYTSVHYIIKANRRTDLRCELQVRTLMEEVWGEVSHTINYPHETEIVCCKEQLRVLARSASGCTRLVDSIFSSHNEHSKK